MYKQCCESMQTNIDSDTAIVFIPKFREYGINVCDGGTSYQTIDFCPWCGNKLPKDLRDEWCDIVYDELGLDDPNNKNLPKEMKDATWWINKGL